MDTARPGQMGPVPFGVDVSKSLLALACRYIFFSATLENLQDIPVCHASLHSLGQDLEMTKFLLQTCSSAPL
jgi:hypothetical protein